MPQFLHGWRRTTGVETLVMACVFMAECAGRTYVDWDMICPADEVLKPVLKPYGPGDKLGFVRFLY